jgi:hypothetical protein
LRCSNTVTTSAAHSGTHQNFKSAPHVIINV